MRFVRRLNEAIYVKRYREKDKGVTHSLIITIHLISKNIANIKNKINIINITISDLCI